MAMASEGLLTEINEDDTIRIVLLVNFETPSYIKGYHEYQKTFSSRRALWRNGTG